jgi:hypothetical protein
MCLSPTAQVIDFRQNRKAFKKEGAANPGEKKKWSLFLLLIHCNEEAVLVKSCRHSLTTAALLLGIFLGIFSC